jgi:uncharacterized membrane protein YkvA (DUF1232 family)
MTEETAYPIGTLPVSYSPPDERRFWHKVRRTLARIPFGEDLLAAYFCAVDRRTPTYVRAVLCGAIAFSALPAALIPAGLGPLGFTADASVIAAAIAAVGGHLQPEHRAAARARLETLAR